MPTPNVLFVLIDALRYGVVADPALRRALTPNIDSLVAGGTLSKVVSLSSNTQFAMPSLLSGTRPLDHGGHNLGCRNRPVCFPEILHEAGYETALFTNCVLYNRDIGFDRGFDKRYVAVNSRVALMQDIEYRLLEPIRRWKSGEMTDQDISAQLQRDFGEILDRLFHACADAPSMDSMPRRCRRTNRRLAAGARRERQLLMSDPLAVAEKLATIPETYYYAALGDRRPTVRLFAVRALNKAYMTLTGWIGRVGWLQRVRFGHFDSLMPLISEILPSLERFIGAAKSPWFAMIHAMDVHSHGISIDQVWRCPIVTLRKVLRFPKVRLSCREHGLHGSILYFVNLTIVDDAIGRLLRQLDDTDQRNNTLIVVVSDHGRTLAGCDPRPTSDLTRRFFGSDLESPLVLAGQEPKLFRPGLRDSRDIGASLLDALGLNVPAEFDGCSALSEAGRTEIVSESAGRGFCDLERDDLNFVVTSQTDKLFSVLCGDHLVVTDYYDLKSDPAELDNLVGKPVIAPRVDALLAALWRDRGDILRGRGASVRALGAERQAIA